jgi:dihydrofolate synthase / folylpolyglutamate synthase
MRFTTEEAALTYIFRSLHKLRTIKRGFDEDTRDTAPTKRLLQARNLLAVPREYAVVTGSKGKGSVTVITAKLLRHLGHSVGTVTSPHLVDWRERIRINGKAIPQADFFRIISDLAPDIDAIEETLTGERYFSPQGIFLAMALQWFNEQGVEAAVLEVGRGGRFDDVAVVPNKLSLFTPILLEHPDYLGHTVERIAWHKAGIIKPYSYVYSVPQSPEAMQVLQTEAQTLEAEFNWIAPKDMGIYLGPAENGLRMSLGRYSEVTLSLMGRYQIENATLALIGAGNMHGRLHGIPHSSQEYIERIRAGLADVVWPGRLQTMQSSPAVYVDGAITVPSAQSLVESLQGYLKDPVILIVAVPVDRDYEGVYRILAPICQTLILTETAINIKIRFPARETALETAQRYHKDILYAYGLHQAVEWAKRRAGTEGTIVLSVAQPLVGEAMLIWGKSFEQI